jgi:hypothetical protein
LDEAYESKEAVAIAIKTALQHEMKRYGYEIVNALVTDLQPDRRVQVRAFLDKKCISYRRNQWTKLGRTPCSRSHDDAIVGTLVLTLVFNTRVPPRQDAMNQIEAQRRMRMASQEKAEGDKILAVTAARAEAEAKELSGQGVARQRKAIVDGLKESVLQFNEGVMGTSPADVMQLMMVTQYLDMLKDVGTKDGAKTIFIPHSPAAVRCPRSVAAPPSRSASFIILTPSRDAAQVGDIQSQMRQGFLEANTAQMNQANPVHARSA